MQVQPLNIQGALLIQPKVFHDPRGVFFESFSEQRYAQAGIQQPFVQDSLSSSSKGVLRGLHYQKNFPQGKLISVLLGKVYDVIVDLRPDSPTFGQYAGLWLDDQLREQIYVPPGCAHGFYVVSERVLFHYKCTEYYHPEDECGLMWNDADLNISWPLIGEPILSAKDQNYAPFNTVFA